MQTQNENKPKNIIIKFVSKHHRDGFLAAAKVAKKKLGKGEGFQVAGISNRFYVNEHLPPQTKLLLKETRQAAQKKTISLFGYNVEVFWCVKPRNLRLSTLLVVKNLLKLKYLLDVEKFITLTLFSGVGS